MSLAPVFYENYLIFPRPFINFPSFFNIGNHRRISYSFNEDLYEQLSEPLLNNKDEFQANVDVQHFKPEELSVNLIGNNTVVIEGMHREKRDQHGFISRQFVRKYCVPVDYDVNQLQSKLSFDGILTITAPRRSNQRGLTYVDIPVIRTDEWVKGGEGGDKICNYP